MIESPETQTDAPAPGVAREAYRQLRAVVAAAGEQLAAAPPFAILGTLALVQWGALAALALRVAHDGWVYDTGSRPASGVVSAQWTVGKSVGCSCDGDVRLLSDRKSTRLNSSHFQGSRMPSSA